MRVFFTCCHPTFDRFLAHETPTSWRSRVPWVPHGVFGPEWTSLFFLLRTQKKVSAPRSKYFLLMICLMDVWMMIWWLHFFPNNKHYAARLFAIDPNCDNSCGCRWWLQITIFPVNQIILAYTYSTYSYWRLDIEGYGDFPWPFSTQDFFCHPKDHLTL